MTDVFLWQATSKSTGKRTFSVRRAQFGDGYSQTSPDGLNHSQQTYNLVFSGVCDDLQPIIDFINAHVGKSFRWKPPFCDESFFQCDEYDVSNPGGDVFTVSAKFIQAHQP